MKVIDWNSVIVEGCMDDMYVSYAEYEDGTELTEDEVIQLEQDHADKVYDIMYQNYVGMAEDWADRDR